MERPLLFVDIDGSVDLPAGQFDPVLKVPAVDRVAGNRALAWIDDLLGPEAWMWAERRDAPTLLIPTNPSVGLARQHVEQLLDWAATAN